MQLQSWGDRIPQHPVSLAPGVLSQQSHSEQTFDGEYIKCVLLLAETFWDEVLDAFGVR